jgi:4-hydroxy-3-methylbut-2-enyl diphosphate reductase
VKLFLCKPRGFCAGVQRAIGTVRRALALWGAPIYVKHEIVHNRHVVEELRCMGAVFIEDLSDVPEGAHLIFSAHGVCPSVREEACSRKLKTVDATCVLVKKVHSAVRCFAQKGYQIVLIGHRHHVEVIGIAGEAPLSTVIVETVADVAKLDLSPDQKMVYLTQTTMGIDEVQQIALALQNRYPHIESMPSICYATQNRQMALRQIAPKVDLVLVVGDPQSSNSNRLRETAEKWGRGSARMIDQAPQIDPEWLQNIQTIAITAGASTPEIIVQQCVERLQLLGVQEIEEIELIHEAERGPLYHIPSLLCRSHQ